MTDQPTPEAVEAFTAILREWGADDLHGWRCEHPDRYGPCTCLAELAGDVAGALRDAIHRDCEGCTPERKCVPDAIREALGLRRVGRRARWEKP